MESSEDDAGTATNASRRASAREKDVGLAEDVNATSSFQQKASEAQSSCRTSAMSEDNFDGDGVPSPSSQDVNTSTEAILDMIDEIVDGPGAPKRLPLTSEVVDALNEELAATSSKLNIIQESAKSDCENLSLPEVASSVNIADSEVTLPVVSDTPAECSTPSDIPADIIKTDSVDALPASSSVPESDEKVVSTESEASVVSNVETETSSSCPPPNIPSSSAEQTEQNVSNVSACEPQDRTVKCVTSSDTRDNVTVESAESTSSDSSVSESKALLVEPQIRSPLRRRLVRPAPSDRRPDSTVSSTVDSQTVDIPAPEQTSSENITKDVTSSSDAVPTIHGNVKPEEISNVSEITFCKAETSVSPPKKIKLIRQKIITGTSKRESLHSQISVLAQKEQCQISVLAQKEQCQSTSSNNHSVNLPNAITESSSIDSLSISQDHNVTPISDNSNLPELPSVSPEKLCTDEHSQPSIELKHSSQNDDSNKGNDCEQSIPEKSILNPLLLPPSSDGNTCHTHQENSSLPTSNLMELPTNIKANDLEPGNICNTHVNEHKSIDYIPLRLSPRQKEHQSNSSKLESRNTVLESRNTELESRISELERTNTELESRNSKLQSQQNELALRTNELEIESNQLDVKDKCDPRSIELQRVSPQIESSSNEPDLKSSKLETRSDELETKPIKLESSSNECEIISNVLPTNSSDLESKSSNSKLETTSTEPQSELESQTIMLEPKCTDGLQSPVLELKKAEHESQNMMSESNSMDIECNSTELQTQSIEIKPESVHHKSQSTEYQSHSMKNKPESIQLNSQSTAVESMSTELEINRAEQELQKQVFELKSSTELESENMIVESKRTEAESQSIVLQSTDTGTEHKSMSTEVEPKSAETQYTVCESKNTELESVSPELEPKSAETQYTVCESKSTELESVSTEIESVSTELKPKIAEPKSQSTVPDSKSTEPKSVSTELEPKIAEPESQRTVSKSKITELESMSPELQPKSAETQNTVSESKSIKLESMGPDFEPKCAETQYTVSKSNSTDRESVSTELEPKSAVPESRCTESKSKITELESMSTELEQKSTEPESQCTVSESKNTESKSMSQELDPKSMAPESPYTESESKSTEIKSMSTILESKSTEIESSTTDVDPMDTDMESKPTEGGSKTIVLQPNTEIESGKSELCKKHDKIQGSKDIEIVLKSSQLGLSCTEVPSRRSERNLRSKKFEAQNSQMESRSNKVEPIQPDMESKNLEIESKNSENDRKTTELNLKSSEIGSSTQVSVNCQPDTSNEQLQEDQKKVPPIKLNLSRSSMSSLSESKLEIEHSSINKNSVTHEESDSTKQVPKLTIKLKQQEDMKSPVPKLTIKPIRHPVDIVMDDKMDKIQQVPCMTKINIKPIVKPVENDNDKPMKSLPDGDKDAKQSVLEQLPCITKLNIKPIPKPPEKINDIHRKSSSSEISESEYSENDETTSTSDQASASDHGPSDVVPKVTIKLGKPGTECEGQFYTEKNVPKLTIKGIQQDEKLIISQSDDVQPEKVPKLTIKTVTKTESQPLSPKLTIKPLKPPDSTNKEGEVPKIRISSELFSSSTDGKESTHVPKITIKPVTRMDGEVKTPKKSTSMCDSPEHIPVVTKLNIKPILKPTDCSESSESFDEKVPVVSKLNIKPVIKPKDIDLNSSVDDVPKVTKLNIKPLKNPEVKSSEDFKDCDESKADIDDNSIPVVTKINIKPIIKPQEEEKEKESENQSSETSNSSDDNADHIPVVTKLNIKPIVKPDELQESSKLVSSSEQSIPFVTKLNIKPLIKPGESSPSSPKKEHSKIDVHSTTIPVVTKLNIKPVIRPEDTELPKSKDENDDKIGKNPPLLMKINMKSVTENFNHDNSHKDSVSNYAGDGLLSIAPKNLKMSNEVEETLENKEHKSLEPESVNDLLQSKNIVHSPIDKPIKQNCVPDADNADKTTIVKKPSLHSPISKTKPSDNATERQHSPNKVMVTKCDPIHTGSPLHDSNVAKEGKIVPNETHVSQENKNIKYRSSVQNCTLLKKLLENTRDSLDKNFEVSQVVNCTLPSERSESTLSACKNIVNSEHSVESGKSGLDRTITRNTATPDEVNDHNKPDSGMLHSMQELSEKVNENVTKPLEITISDKITNQSSGQDSPRIILKINKTDHGPSAKIITEDVKRPDPIVLNYADNTQDNLNDKQSPKRHIANSRRKQPADTALNLSSGKRLRSSRIVENTEKLQVKRNVGKRPTTETTPPQNKEPELSVLQTKRLKLGQLLSGNKSLSISPVSPQQTSPTKTNSETKPGVKAVNHSLLNNDNCSKNGNSKLHNILSNLKAKQMKALSLRRTNCSEKAPTVHSDIECNASMSSADAVEITHVENSHPELQQMIINENSDFRDFAGPEDTSQDPLEMDNIKPVEVPPPIVDIPKPVELTPQPKKRGRPRKLPVSEGAKPVVALPVPALEERPQRSLRLMRDRPAILQKPRGRGRGRGGRRSEATPPAEPETITIIETVPDEPVDEKPTIEIDPTSSRIKLPRMTEALDKMPSVCVTPLSSRRRNSSGTFSSTGETSELKILLDSTPPKDEFPNTPEPSGSGRGRGGRGSRGGRGRTPRGRGRRGGGRGAMYMKETMGIYGRVCGPATTTVQLFEEETCMMDDNATPAKPSHLLDEDSQGSVKSSTNESNKMKKSKFADLFDSSKVWTAGDVKEYTWPPSHRAEGESKVMMIQEQVAMFLGVKSFKRRYPELKRRTVGGEERDYILSKGLVTEALCDLGITAVDACEVLDIMLSDYPHKYEEFRTHQRQRQLEGLDVKTQKVEMKIPKLEVEESKVEEKVSRVDIKQEKPVEHKPEVPKIDAEKTRQDMAAAAIASASEWNARANAARACACADLQSLTILRARARQAAPSRPHLRPPAGFYPHALLPGQYQHSYRAYTPDQLRYFPLNTVLAAPPAPPSTTDCSSESEPDWGSRCSSSDDSDLPTHHSAKRKKLTKVKRSSHAEASTSSVKEEIKTEEVVVETCRVCKLRLEANRRHTQDRFLVCANCNAKLHPSCVELSTETIRKCREYPWQCAECKTCCSCRQPADDDKMLFCDMCDRGFHIYCVGLDNVPSGRWHCVECAICKSCGARSPAGPAGAGAGAAGAPGPPGTPAPPADWHHQTRRGPGGHKVYSHSLCTPCARAYRIGRYCPLCERSFIGPKGTMQLVICKLCDRQLHQECVKRTGAAVRVLDHTCGWCRRGGITSRAAAVRLAPRTIATLFMAKRRFNKYAHRQYMESRLRQDAPSAEPDAEPEPDEPDADEPDAMCADAADERPAPSPPSPPSELV